MRASRSFLAVAPLLVLAVAAPSNRVEAQFHADVDLVTLDVCVRDRSGQFVRDLRAEDFLVLENGVPQHITVFEPADRLPLNVVLLIDRSASMHGDKLDRAQRAATEFAHGLASMDRLEVIAFNQRAIVVTSDGQRDPGWTAKLLQLSATGSTALYDAMILAANQFRLARRAQATLLRRDVIIVLSDGEDTASVVGFDEVLPLLRRSGALVYSLSLRNNGTGQTTGATWPLQQLARDTGARAIGVPQLDSLDDLYAQINQEVRQMYRLGYVSTDGRASGEWRQIAVRIHALDVQARTRSGYYAAPSLRSQPF
jgi:VWFA-related protein